jgi:hypothetical protein
MIRTYNEYHLGDNLIHLNFLRRLGLPATHYCHQHYHVQLQPLCEDTDILLLDLPARPADALNVWIGRDNAFQSRSPDTTWWQFYSQWFAQISAELDTPNPIHTRHECMFDYPALLQDFPAYDYLIINSPPLSGQLPSFSQEWFSKKVLELQDQGYTVITTYPTGICPATLDLGMTVSNIGALSREVSHIITVDTGPMWPTFNVHNKYTVLSRTVYSTTCSIDLFNTQTFPTLP